MKLQDIRLMYEYNYWANKLILATCEKVTPEQFTAPTSFPWKSLRGTVVHTMDAEYGWRILCKETRFTVDLVPEDFPDVESVRKHWLEEEQAMREYLASLSDDALTTIVRYQPPDGPLRERVLWHCLYHVVNHGMQHRSESAAMLTSYGQSPGDFDFTLFMNEYGKKARS